MARSSLPPLRLVEPNRSAETIKCLEDLLEAAKSGELIGIACVALYVRREYTATVSGAVRSNPTFSRGMLRALDDRLGALASGRDF